MVHTSTKPSRGLHRMKRHVNSLPECACRLEFATFSPSLAVSAPFLYYTSQDYDEPHVVIEHRLVLFALIKIIKSSSGTDHLLCVC